MDIIISLGGSLIVPEEIDVSFLKSFHSLILDFIKKGNKVAIIAGGGKTCRKYQAAAGAIVNVSPEDLDWLGIHATRLNAQLLRTIFRAYSKPQVIKNPAKAIDFKESILIGSGWKPGCSTDKDAVLLAENLGIKTLINLTNVTQVYNKDPKKHNDAKPLDKISWKQMQSIVGTKWSPGLNMPFDPVATKLASKLGLKVVILGPCLNNLKSFLENKQFKGTVIE